MNKEITPEQKKEWMEEIKKFLHAESNYPHEFIDGLSTPVQTDWKESTKLLMEAYGDNPKDFPYPQQKASTPATDEQDINFENEATEYAKKYWIPDSIEYTAARLGYKAAARKHSVTPVANKEQGSIYKSVQYGEAQNVTVVDLGHGTVGVTTAEQDEHHDLVFAPIPQTPVGDIYKGFGDIIGKPVHVINPEVVIVFRNAESVDVVLDRLQRIREKFVVGEISVTPVLSEQEIKEEAERRYPPNLTEKQVGLKWTTIDENEPERKAFIAGAALTAHQTSNSVNILTELGGKQHTDK